MPWKGDFIQTEPENGAKPTFDTEFKILHDKSNLYVAIRAFEEQPDSIVISTKPRDFFDGDYVEINIDSDFDRKDAFSFTVTAAGIRGDEHIKTSENWSNDWNPNWTVKTKINKKNWIAELKIPLSELEINSKKKNWGVQVNRSIERLDETSSWTSIPDEDKWVEYFGLLKGIENIPISKVFSYTEKIHPELLKQDFSALYKSLKLSYPSLYRYHSKDYISQNFEHSLNVLQKEMTLSEYYKIVSTFVSHIGDGHMNVKFPDYFYQSHYEKQKALPFKLEIDGDEAFIVENYSENKLLNNSRIIALDGKLIHKIIYKLSEFIPSDGYSLTGKYFKISNDFNFYYSLISGSSDYTKIDFIPEGQSEVHSTRLTLLSDVDIQQIKTQRNLVQNTKSFEYNIIDNIAILTIRTFNHAEGFKEFVDESFKKIAEANVKKLILDLRGNGGGEESNAIHLYSYLTTKPFKYYNRYEVNIIPNRKIKQESTLISYETINFLADISTIDSKNRCVLTDLEPLDNRFLNPNELQEPKRENNFNGKLVVLINGGSFSATSEICAIMKRDNRATFLGTETGGGFDGNTSGIYDQITLPNSRLKIKIPLVKYVSAVEESPFMYGRGIMPDYPIIENKINFGELNTDGIIDFAIKYLSLKN